MKKSNNNFTLEENLVLTNEELMSNWTKLASLVLTYEKNLSWESAKTKASLLLKEGLAVAYIETARKNPAGMPESKPDVPEPKSQHSKIVKLSPASKTVYHENYERLLKIAPGIETRLLKANVLNGDEVYGKSEATGYMDFSLELINRDNDSYYLAIAHYHIQNGDMIPDPDMVIRVDLKKKMVEALTFQDAYGYKRVYEDYTDRSVVDTRQRKGQNAFLTSWLKNLKTQGHKIRWKERETTGILNSELIVQYDKSAEEGAKNKVEPEEEVKAPEKPEKHQVAYSKEELEKLAFAVIYNEQFEGLQIEKNKAESKAEKLMQNGEAVGYLLHLIENIQASLIVDTMTANYYKLLYLIPDLLERLSSENTSVLLFNEPPKGKVKKYEVVYSTDVKNYRAFVIQEMNGEGNLSIQIAVLSKYISVEIISGGFAGEKDYYDQGSTQQEQLTANEMFGKWLNGLIAKQYMAEWKGEQITETIAPEIQWEISQAPTESPVEDPLAEYTKRADEIPDFEIGKVQLVDAHLKAGITQQDIDWINQNRQGMTLVPRKKPMINNTKDKEMDKAIHAMKPGFRISATGKLYYEGRSNRSDKRNTGL